MITIPTSTHLVDLDPLECHRLLAAADVGRLVWHGPDGMTAIPVNHSWRDGRILIRTTAYSAIARECDDAEVGYEVDDLDPGRRLGWSVLARGRARVLWTDADRQAEPHPWPSGPRPLLLEVDVRSVHGRRLTQLPREPQRQPRRG